MKRIVKDPIVRRNEILDAAEPLMATKGYEQMTIQDIVDELQIAKGTVYHYFNSKEAVLGALVERMGEQMEQLIARRKKMGFVDQSLAQNIIISLALLSTLAVLVFSAFDHRFAWSPVPPAISVFGDALIMLGLFIPFLSFRGNNSYGGATIEVVESQKVMSTGLYAHIRHPQYLGNIIMVIGIPLALGSCWGLVVLAITIPVLAWRILDEEKLLEKDLTGYKEYEQKVRYRLMPYLW